MTEETRAYNRARLQRRAIAQDIHVGDSVMILAHGRTPLTSRWDPQYIVTRIQGTTHWVRHQTTNKVRKLHREKLRLVDPTITWDEVPPRPRRQRQAAHGPVAAPIPDPMEVDRPEAPINQPAEADPRVAPASRAESPATHPPDALASPCGSPIPLDHEQATPAYSPDLNMEHALTPPSPSESDMESLSPHLAEPSQPPIRSTPSLRIDQSMPIAQRLPTVRYPSPTPSESPSEPYYDPQRKRVGPKDYTHVTLLPGLKVKFSKGYPTRSASKR